MPAPSRPTDLISLFVCKVQELSTLAHTRTQSETWSGRDRKTLGIKRQYNLASSFHSVFFSSLPFLPILSITVPTEAAAAEAGCERMRSFLKLRLNLDDSLGEPNLLWILDFLRPSLLFIPFPQSSFQTKLTDWLDLALLSICSSQTGEIILRQLSSFF
jgi:hypothetical protein